MSPTHPRMLECKRELLLLPTLTGTGSYSVGAGTSLRSLSSMKSAFGEEYSCAGWES